MLTQVVGIGLIVLAVAVQIADQVVQAIGGALEGDLGVVSLGAFSLSLLRRGYKLRN